MEFSQKLKNIEESATLKLNASAQALKSAGRKILNLTAGELDFFTPLPVQKAVAKKLKENKYTPALGLEELRLKLAAFINKKYETAYEASNIAVTAGAKSGLFFVLGALLDKDDEVIIPSPAWVSYKEQVKIWQGRPVMVPLRDNFDLDASAILKKISSRTKAIIINSPHNPTGKIFSLKELKSLAQGIKNKDITVIFDAIYDDLIYNEQSHDPARAISLFNPENFVLIHGFSKSFALTGWRLGYLAAAPVFIKAINKIQGQASGNAALLSQFAGLAALADLTISGHFLGELKKRREVVLNLLTKAPALKVQSPDGAFYIFIDIRKITGDSEKFCATLLKEKQVALVPGEAFGAPGFIRVSFAAEEKILKEGIKRLNEFHLSFPRRHPVSFSVPRLAPRSNPGVSSTN